MKLIVDTMCGRLARYLRMCGYDATYALDRGIEADQALIALAAAEDRRIVTRDAELAARADDALLLESRGIDGQLRELLDAGIDLSLTKPTRCGRCNGTLDRVRTGSTPDYAPSPDIEEVYRCGNCGQYFWRGSHWDDVANRLASL